MTLRSDLIDDRVRAVADREAEKEDDDFQHNQDLFPLPNSARLDERHKRRVQTLNCVLSERIRAEKELPLAEEDRESWYQILRQDASRLIEDGFNQLRFSAQSDYGQFLHSGIHSGIARLLNDDQRRLRERYEREAKIIQRERELREKTGGSMSVAGMAININSSTIASLNVASAVGDIQATVNVLNSAGEREMAEALKRLAESFAEAHALNDSLKREAVELVASLGDELTRPSEERRSSAIRAIARRVWEIARSVSEAITVYDALRAAARAATGIDLPG
jgi:hypothetical protein